MKICVIRNIHLRSLKNFLCIEKNINVFVNIYTHNKFKPLKNRLCIDRFI